MSDEATNLIFGLSFAVLTALWILWGTYVLWWLSQARSHGKMLSDNILNKLTHARIRPELPLSISVEPEGLRERRYYSQAVQHLNHRSYRKMWKLWSGIKKSVRSYNSEAKKTVVRIEKTIHQRIEEHYPNVLEKERYQEKAENAYFSLLIPLIYRAVYDSVKEGSPDVDWVISSHPTASSYGLGVSRMIVMQTTEKEFADEKLMEDFLTSVDRSIRGRIQNLYRKQKPIENCLKDFRERMTALCENIDLGRRLKGKCDACKFRIHQ